MSNYCQKSHFSPFESRKRTCLVCMTQCVWHFIPLILHSHGENIFSSHSHTKWHYVLWMAWIFWWSTDGWKVWNDAQACTISHCDTAMRWCVCATLYLQSVNDSHVSFPGVKKKGVYNIMFFFLGKPHFLLSVVGCRKKKWQKWRGEMKDQKAKSDKKSSLMKQENTTGAGSRWVAASLVLWGVCC